MTPESVSISDTPVGMMSISLDDVLFHANHGLFEQETAVGNDFKVNLTVHYAVTTPVDDTHLDALLSYADLYAIVAEEMACPRKLLETLAVTIAERVRAKFPQVTSGLVSITKMRPPIAHMRGSATVTYSW